MRQYVNATLCCTLLLASKAAFSIETSLLDRLAQEKVIGDGRPRAYPIPAQPGAPRQAATDTAQASEENAQLASQLREANGQVMALQQQLSDLARGNALLEEQLMQRQNDAQAAPGTGPQALGNNSTLDADLGAARSEIAGLKKQAAELQAANQQLMDQQAAQSALQAKTGATDAGKRVIVNSAASKDVRVSYAVGAWYAESAPQETQKLASIGKKLDLQAFSQGFSDKINNRLQLPQDKLSAELDGAQQQLETAMLSKNEKQSKVLMDAAAKEKGAVKMPDGVVYRILDKGNAPTATDKHEILFDIIEQLSTGEELNRETQTKSIKELSPLFQTIFKQLGRGGSAKILTPVTAAHATQMGLPPGTVSIITVKVAGIK